MQIFVSDSELDLVPKLIEFCKQNKLDFQYYEQARIFTVGALKNPIIEKHCFRAKTNQWVLNLFSKAFPDKKKNYFEFMRLLQLNPDDMASHRNELYKGLCVEEMELTKDEMKHLLEVAEKL